MNFDQPKGDKPSHKEDKGFDQIERSLVKLFDSIAAGQLPIEEFNKIFDRFLTAKELTDLLLAAAVNEIKKGLVQCFGLKDRAEFMKKIKAILAPIWEIKNKQPKIFEDIYAREGMAREGFSPLNERISYGVEKDFVHFHLAVSHEVKERLPALFLDGMQKLARVVKTDPAIKEIGGTSWIVATKKYGSMLKQIGFDIIEVPAYVKETYFKGEDRPIARAVMSREKFLQTFGQ